ncbi:MAG: oxygen-independent coproporphyrinogen III oxidase [Deltaproteobacteria bacterium]|nr:oxygen-independent coproporphyrinogen III oxidase [Deltaproteobacteria bacterium]
MTSLPSDLPQSHDVPHDLIARYDRPGPRYTSYPTAPEWIDLTHDDATAALSRVAADPRPISLYVHLPFCERMCLFCGCNVVVLKSRDKVARYLAALTREIALVQSIVGDKKLVQLHLGGGTPTFFTPDELERLGAAIFAAFPPLPDAEIGVEVDPMVTTRAHLTRLRGLGWNRLSMGVQDFQDDVQEVTDRRQPDQKSAAIFTLGRELGFHSINVDLMYGLPKQTAAHLAHSARRCIELGADRIAVFGYAHVPWMKPHQKKLEAHGIPTAEDRWRMFNAARSTLMSAGYQAIGFDHFAKATDELARAFGARKLNRNFQGYTVLEPTHLIGLGLSAISDAGGAFLQNAKKLPDYYRAIEAGRFATEKGRVLTHEDHLRRTVIIELMCNLYLDFAMVEKRFGIEFGAHFANELSALAPLIADGLVVQTPHSLEITERGRVFARNVAMPFDAYLARAGAADKPRFSRTV